MYILFDIIIAMEMILVNLCTIHRCFQKKYTLPKILAAYLAYTCVLFVSIMPLLMKTSAYGNGNGLFVIAGFLYLIPIQFLYKTTIRKTVTTICSSWIYTMLAFTVSVQIVKAFIPDHFSSGVLIIQTAIYALTFRAFAYWVKVQLWSLINTLSQKLQNLLLFASLFWFVTCISLNYSYVSEYTFPKVFSLLLVGGNAFFTYHLLHMAILSSNSIDLMKKTLLTDHLTGLPNRHCLIQDGQNLIDNTQAFHLIFLDLDLFKQINDKYGHAAGDRYLIEFSLEVKKMLVPYSGTLYRIAGDEFICLLQADEEALKCLFNDFEEMQNRRLQDMNFLGVSMGCASYPDEASDLDHLMSLADSRMYQYKQNQKHRDFSDVP